MPLPLLLPLLLYHGISYCHTVITPFSLLLLAIIITTPAGTAGDIIITPLLLLFKRFITPFSLPH
jgi:hypothetical protein